MKTYPPRAFHLLFLPCRLLIALLLLLLPLPAAAAGGAPLPEQDALPPQPDATVQYFLPAISRAATLSINRIEATQAVQTTAHTVPLVRNRPTAVRVTIQAHSPESNVTVLLHGQRGSITLAGSPLRKTGVSAPVQPAAGSAQAVFLLPASWLSGDVTLTAEVLAAGSSLPSGRRSLPISFTTVTPLRVVVVPVRYLHAPTGASYNATTTNMKFLADVQAMFPVPSINLTVRAGVTFRGDLTADDGSPDGGEWSRLYDLIASLKTADGAAATTIYVGLLPQSAMQRHRIAIAGIGGSIRVAAGFDVQLVLAHELGHTLGRGHAPCGGPTRVDPAYPYAGGIIGAVGYDPRTGALLDPYQTTDLMSYCSEWVSDYTFAGMMDNQIAAASEESAQGMQPGGASLLVRANLGDDGAAELLPVYALAAPPAPNAATGNYSIALFDASGTLIEEWPVAEHAADEYDVSIVQIHARLPMPTAPVARVEVRRAGVPIATRDLFAIAAATAAPATVALEGDEVVVHNPAGSPLLVRCTAPTATTTLAIDMAESLARFQLADLPGGPCNLEVVAADSGSLVSAAAGPPLLTTPNRPPALQVDAAAGPGGGSVVVLGVAWDAEDGSLPDVLWRVNGSPAGHGPLLQLELGAEPMLIEASVTDREGLTATATSTVWPISASLP